MNRLLVAACVACGVLLATSTVATADDVVDPGMKIIGKMGTAVGQLKKLDTGKPTQKTQKEIVSSLDELIAELEKECEACKGVGANPTRPANASIIRSGAGGMGDLHAARKDGKQWGELPPHERDRILQSMTEGFPAHYQRILERYYKKLATETTAGSEDGVPVDGAADRAPTKPAGNPAGAAAGKPAGAAAGKPAGAAAAKPAAAAPAAKAAAATPAAAATAPAPVQAGGASGR